MHQWHHVTRIIRKLGHDMHTLVLRVLHVLKPDATAGQKPKLRVGIPFTVGVLLTFSVINMVTGNVIGVVAGRLMGNENAPSPDSSIASVEEADARRLDHCIGIASRTAWAFIDECDQGDLEGACSGEFPPTTEALIEACGYVEIIESPAPLDLDLDERQGSAEATGPILTGTMEPSEGGYLLLDAEWTAQQDAWLEGGTPRDEVSRKKLNAWIREHSFGVGYGLGFWNATIAGTSRSAVHISDLRPEGVTCIDARALTVIAYHFLPSVLDREQPPEHLREPRFTLEYRLGAGDTTAHSSPEVPGAVDALGVDGQTQESPVAELALTPDVPFFDEYVLAAGADENPSSFTIEVDPDGKDCTWEKFTATFIGPEGERVEHFVPDSPFVALGRNESASVITVSGTVDEATIEAPDFFEIAPSFNVKIR